jgi:hypothetical protein
MNRTGEFAVQPQSPCYPADQAGRQHLADELAARGFKPTQAKQHFDRDKIDKMVDAMRDRSFDWNKASFSSSLWACATIRTLTQVGTGRSDAASSQ